MMQMAHDRPLKPDSKSCKKGELPEIMFYLLIPSDNQVGLESVAEKNQLILCSHNEWKVQL